jgi:hypothetical protein
MLIFQPERGTFPVRMKKAVECVKSRGTVIAEKARAKANKYSDEKRSALLEKGMAIINR